MPQLLMLVPPPDNWQDFETLMFSVCEAKWMYDSVEKYGKPGQAQQGVDIYVHRHQTQDWVGVQCKRKSLTTSAGNRKAEGLLTLKEIKEEIEKATSFKPALKEFIIVTTASKDAHIQSDLRAIASVCKSTKQFYVSVWFWEDIQSLLNHHMHVMYRYYEKIMQVHSAYDPDKFILSLLHLAFSRQAFNTYLHMENSGDDLLQALKDTQKAIKTGILTDRESGNVLGTAPAGAAKLSKPEWRASLASVEKQLSLVRDDYTRAVKDGTIVQHVSCLEVRNHETSERLNRMRGVAIAELNTVLSEAGLDQVESKLLETI